MEHNNNKLESKPIDLIESGNNQSKIQFFDRASPENVSQIKNQTQLKQSNPGIVESIGNAFEGVGDLFTGNSKETDQSRGLSEFSLPSEFSGRSIKTSLGLLATLDKKKQKNILMSNYPKLIINPDSKGNFIVDASAYKDELELEDDEIKTVLNSPGFSGRDAAFLVSNMAAFTPAGAIGKLIAGSIAKKALAVGAASAATQAAIDIGGQASGATEEVSIENIDKTDVAVAGISGAFFEGLFSVLADSIPFFRQQINIQGITEEVRKTFKQAAIEIGEDPAKVTDELINSFLESTKQATNPSELVAIQGEKEFGIDLFEGQRSGNQKQLNFEDQARVGNFGGKAQEEVLKKEASQSAQANDAKIQIQNEIAKGGELIADQADSGAVIGQGIKNKSIESEQLFRNKYEDVNDATLSSDHLNKLINATKKSMNSVEFDKTLPETKKILDLAISLQKTLKGLKGNLKPFHIKQIENMRKRLVTAFGSSEKSDRRQISIMQNAWDDWMDITVKNSLFNGDSESLQTLKSARGLYKDYRKKFTEQPIKRRGSGSFPDPEGRMIEKIISANPTNIQVINSIFGAGETFGNQAGKNMAIKMKSILGESSDEWATVKQAAFLRLIKTMPDGKTISGQQTLTAISKAMKNKELINEVLSPIEIGLITRFATQVKRTQPFLVKQRANPSGTSAQNVAALKSIFGRLMQVLGMATGNPAITIAGTGVNLASGFRSASKIKNSARPFQNKLNTVDYQVGGAVAATNTGLQDN